MMRIMLTGFLTCILTIPMCNTEFAVAGAQQKGSHQNRPRRNRETSQRQDPSTNNDSVPADPTPADPTPADQASAEQVSAEHAAKLVSLLAELTEVVNAIAKPNQTDKPCGNTTEADSGEAGDDEGEDAAEDNREEVRHTTNTAVLVLKLRAPVSTIKVSGTDVAISEDRQGGKNGRTRRLTKTVSVAIPSPYHRAVKVEVDAQSWDVVVYPHTTTVLDTVTGSTGTF